LLRTRLRSRSSRAHDVSTLERHGFIAGRDSPVAFSAFA
jgi:hypothetical protein